MDRPASSRSCAWPWHVPGRSACRLGQYTHLLCEGPRQWAGCQLLPKSLGSAGNASRRVGHTRDGLATCASTCLASVESSLLSCWFGIRCQCGVHCKSNATSHDKRGAPYLYRVLSAQGSIRQALPQVCDCVHGASIPISAAASNQLFRLERRKGELCCICQLYGDENLTLLTTELLLSVLQLRSADRLLCSSATSGLVACVNRVGLHLAGNGTRNRGFQVRAWMQGPVWWKGAAPLSRRGCLALQ